MIPAQPDLAAVYKQLAKSDTINRFLTQLKRSHDQCIDDGKTGEMFSDDTLDALASSAMETALDCDHIQDSWERMPVMEQNLFIDYLIDTGAIPHPLTK